MIKAKYDNTHLEALESDNRSIFLLNDKARLTVVNATEVVNQMRANHKCGLLESYVLGQAYVAGLLLTSIVKGNDRVLLQIECGGPIKGISIESWACGAVRGYLLENPIPLTKELTTLDTSLLFGPGFITISRILEGAKEPVSGTCMLQHGNIAKDLAQFFEESEQTPTLFYISIQYDNNGNIIGSGGIFIQALPGCDDDFLSYLQELSSALPSLGLELSKRCNIKDYVLEHFAAAKPKLLETNPIGFSCPCSRVQFERYLNNLPQKEKEEILKSTFPLELECFNCGSIYSFTKSEVETLFTKEK